MPPPPESEEQERRGGYRACGWGPRSGGETGGAEGDQLLPETNSGEGAGTLEARTGLGGPQMRWGMGDEDAQREALADC
ncbi:hypothetical protein NDU88_003108 [Pleurodeles waltl]|uniref:Uncharacterized protein n=1 Tax=Pleurodeles waltl TaxID=8319 RepID=A0AAV7NFH0_PLEWA|nr:hypothetical protein NDU88_003108 [Pleurodeles waltl]